MRRRVGDVEQTATAKVSLRPDFDDRIQAEAITLANVCHPSIPTLLEYRAPASARPSVVMATALGLDVARLLDDLEALPAHIAALVARDVALALDHCHGRGIYHRDVSDTNILIGPDARVWLIDFGCASPHEPGRANVVFGKIRTTAPEARRGRARAPADVWALGCVLCQMVLGEPAFADTDDRVMLQAMDAGLPDIPRDLHGTMREAIVSALHPVAGLRPTAAELAELLQREVRPDSRAVLAAFMAPLCRPK